MVIGLSHPLFISLRLLPSSTCQYLLLVGFTDGSSGGHDVFVDIGDKHWGVLCIQRYFGGISGNRSLHVGDQFLSAGSNDFKVRLAFLSTLHRLALHIPILCVHSSISRMTAVPSSFSSPSAMHILIRFHHSILVSDTRERAFSMNPQPPEAIGSLPCHR